MNYTSGIVSSWSALSAQIMDMKLVLILLCCSVAWCSKLELVQVFFRHGSRTPEKKDVYPTDPYTLQDFMPMGWGQLTNTGKQRAYQLGKLLRKRYDSFLGDIYTPDIAVTTSTDYDRTKMSALLVLAGLFPPAPSQRWNEELNWNPIPYHMDKTDYDYFIRRPTGYCPQYVTELDKVLGSEVVKKMLDGHRKTLDYMAKHAGKPMDTLMDAFRLYQTLNAEANLNMTLPKWTESIYPQPLELMAAQQCFWENYSDTLKRLNGGRILGKVIENMMAKAGNLTPGRKIYLYSGHENNVINILASLKLFDAHVPKYSAAVILELHRLQSDEHAVKVFYARDVFDEPTAMPLGTCEDNLCPFDKFLDYTRPYVPVNYTAECRSGINLG